MDTERDLDEALVRIIELELALRRITDAREAEQLARAIEAARKLLKSQA